MFGDGIVRYNRTNVRSSSYTAEHWRNTAVYFEKNGRYIDYIQIARRNWLQSYKNGNIGIQQLRGPRREGLVEEQSIQDAILNFVSCGSIEDINNRVAGAGGEDHRENTGSKMQNKASELHNWIRQICVAPINHIFSTVAWTTGKYKYMPKNNILLKTITDLHKVELSELSIQDFFLKFLRTEPTNLIFNASINSTLK